MDRDEAYAIPKDVFHPFITDLNTTEKEDGSRYWHVHLNENGPGEIALILPKRRTTFPLMKFSISLPQKPESASESIEGLEHAGAQVLI